MYCGPSSGLRIELNLSSVSPLQLKILTPTGNVHGDVIKFWTPQLGCEESSVHPTPGARVVAGQPSCNQVGTAAKGRCNKILYIFVFP